MKRRLLGFQECLEKREAEFSADEAGSALALCDQWGSLGGKVGWSRCKYMAT